MKANLQSRLSSLAQTRLQTQEPLTPADVAALQQETGATPAEIRTGYANALKAGLSAVQNAGDATAALRRASEGGMFAGQPVGSAATSPLLMGSNLQTPAELVAPFAQMGQQMLALAQAYGAGKASAAEVKTALEAMPAQPDAAKDALWSPAGQSARDTFNQGQTALAALLPDLKADNFGGYTLEESRLQMQLTGTMAEPAAHQQVAQELLDKYPDSRLAPWAQSIIQGQGPIDAPAVALLEQLPPPRPSFKPAEGALDDDTGIKLDGEAAFVVAYYAGPSQEKQLLDQGFTKTGTTDGHASFALPTDDEGLFKPGRYQVGSATLHVGDNNALEVELHRNTDDMYTYEMDRMGFAASGDHPLRFAPAVD